MQIPKFPFWICALMLCGAPTLRAMDNPAQAAARVALEQKLQELDGNPPATPASASSVPPAGAASAPASAPPVAVTPAGATPVVETPGPAPTAIPATLAPVEAAPTVVKSASKKTVVKPLPAATAVAVPLSKEERLRWLLVRYKADQITPEEYHTQRAAILAEP